MICAAVERCAGIEVGKTFLAVCVMTGPLGGEAMEQRRRFGTTVVEWQALREWLKTGAGDACGEGEHGYLLGTGMQHLGGKCPNLWGPRARGQESQRAPDG